MTICCEFSTSFVCKNMKAGLWQSHITIEIELYFVGNHCYEYVTFITHGYPNFIQTKYLDYIHLSLKFHSNQIVFSMQGSMLLFTEKLFSLGPFTCHSSHGGCKPSKLFYSHQFLKFTT